MWMLSGAPDNPNEAVSLRECIDLARETAIPSVVLISDACRSAADSLRTQRVRGSLIFPNALTGGRLRPDVDRFFAALPGDPALELPVDNSSKTFEGLYTSSFLDAFKHPQTTMVRTVDGVDVVPNRSLKSYLVDDVSRRATAKSVRLQQLPDAILECGETTYIGRAVKPDTTAPPPPRDSCPATSWAFLARSDRRFRPADCLFWLCLQWCWPRWRDALVLMQPATVARWQREGLRGCWMRRPRHRPGRPCIDTQVRALIRRMAMENRLWALRGSTANY
jgi:hypothetical protein